MNVLTSEVKNDYTFILTEEGKTQYKNVEDTIIAGFYIREYLSIICLQSFLEYYENYSLKYKQILSANISVYIA